MNSSSAKAIPSGLNVSQFVTDGHGDCFERKERNCSDQYYQNLNDMFDGLWKLAAVSMYVIFFASVVSNVTILLIVSQRKYRAKLVPRSLIFIYAANLIYVTVVSFFSPNIPFKDHDYLKTLLYCKSSYFVICFMRSVTNWTLVCVSIIHASTIYFPANFGQFRSNANYSYLVLLVVCVIAILSTTLLADIDLVGECFYLDRKLCHFHIPFNFVILSYICPMALTILFSVFIVYSILYPGIPSITTIESQSSYRVNRLIIGCTFSFTLTSIPLILHFYSIKVQLEDKSCDFYFYDRAVQHVAALNFTSSTFGLDTFLFMTISRPFREEVFNVYKRIFISLGCLSADSLERRSLFSRPQSLSWKDSGARSHSGLIFLERPQARETIFEMLPKQFSFYSLTGHDDPNHPKVIDSKVDIVPETPLS